jgi:16S rRNA (uracil1498-N3)-methyltransferase
MAVKSVYLPQPFIQGDLIHITGDEHRHLLVARAEPNEAIEIFDGQGTAWAASVESVGKRETIARVRESWTIQRDPIELVLGLALIRIAAFELALEKVVEVGVTRIVPFTADRSNAAAGNRYERWMRILIEAAKQSKHYHLPALDPPTTFERVISLSGTSKIVFAEHEGGPLKSAVTGSPVLYVIGPEGGWTDREVAAARDRGFHAVSLGASILKAETAAIVGAALIRYELACRGGLGPPAFE